METDKTVIRSSYLHNGISYTGKTISLYWIGALWYMRFFHRGMPLLNWGQMVCMGYRSYTFIRIKFTNMSSIYMQSCTFSEKNYCGSNILIFYFYVCGYQRCLILWFMAAKLHPGFILYRTGRNIGLLLQFGIFCRISFVDIKSVAKYICLFDVE